MTQNQSFTSVTIFVLASTETDLLSETTERILSTCNADDIDKVVIVLKSADCPSSGRAKEIIAQSEKICTYVQRGHSFEECMAELPPLARGSHFVVMGADAEMSPETVADFIREAKEHPNRIICASKWLNESEINDYGHLRAFCTRSLNRFTSLLYGTKSTDLFSLYQIFPTELYRKIKFSNNSRFLYEFTLKPLRLGEEYSEIPTVYKRKEIGKSSFGVSKLIRVALRFIVMAIEIRFTPKRWLRNDPQ